MILVLDVVLKLLNFECDVVDPTLCGVLVIEVFAEIALAGFKIVRIRFFIVIVVLL